MLQLVLKAFAFVCFFLAAIPLGAAYCNRLIAAGLAFWVGSEIFAGGYGLFVSSH